MRHLAKVTVGQYEDEFADEDPNILAEFYGVDGPMKRRRRGQTGAGHSPDTDDEDEPMEDESDSDTPEDNTESEDEVDISGAWALDKGGDNEGSLDEGIVAL